MSLCDLAYKHVDPLPFPPELFLAVGMPGLPRSPNLLSVPKKKYVFILGKRNHDATPLDSCSVTEILVELK